MNCTNEDLQQFVTDRQAVNNKKHGGTLQISKQDLYLKPLLDLVITYFNGFCAKRLFERVNITLEL
jgi:hypothetical protein